MKKLLALLLALAMLLSLCACGTSDTDSEDSEDNKSSKTEGKATDTSPETVTFEEVVVVDSAECLIKVTGVNNDDFQGYSLDVYAENRSSDKKYTFSVDSAAINGVNCSTYYYETVEPGKKSNKSIAFLDDDLERYGLGAYTDIELSFRVSDSEDWFADDVANESVHIYPYGEAKATKFVRQAQPGDKVLVDNNDVTVIATGFGMREYWGYCADLYVVNKTDRTLGFSAEDASLNDFMTDAFLDIEYVDAGNSTFGSVIWSESEMEANNITDVTDMEFTLRAYDVEDWYSDDVLNAVITITP
ncbi:MAG: hypothetical protein IKT58_05580 [Oscillospiraceae bacterium]|nr:hypothetical protein [Oscillospiraceae bacterium]